ncbi:MAG: glycosyltransferase family 39 protein [Flavobacteriales bacterium]|nr:glycosyltransferase family 39 protein [Flavobacteriales bacterium]
MFGLEPWAVRIPSVLWLTALVPVTYRMGCLLFDERAGWIAALLTTSSYYMLELTAGAITTDHNDAVFIATVSCSCWALLELWNNGARRWALLVGFFSACAILTKVYVGGVVFLPWFAMAVLRRSRKDWMDLLLGAGVAMVLSGLWFGSLAFRFPEALVAQFAFDTGHLGGVVEGHTGGAGYHFRVIDELMFPFTWWLVVPSYAALLLRSKRKEHRVFLGLLFIAVHAVFAWAETKMPSFTLVLVPLYLIAVGTSLVLVTETLIVERFRNRVIGLVPVLLAVPFLELEVLQYRHTLASPPKQHQQWRQQQMEAIPVLANLESIIAQPVNSVVYNVPALHHIQFMFQSGIEATDQMPEAADVARLRNIGYTVYAVQDGEPLDRFTNGVEVIRDEVLRFPDVGRPR